MTTWTRRAVSLCTDCLASDDLEATARRTGFVQRVSQRSGTLLLALVPCGTWREATTPLAPWAAQGTQGDAQGEGSPDALPQRSRRQYNIGQVSCGLC
jgi:hypothetical protein